jgi:hypothetical protein
MWHQAISALALEPSFWQDVSNDQCLQVRRACLHCLRLDTSPVFYLVCCIDGLCDPVCVVFQIHFGSDRQVAAGWCIWRCIQTTVYWEATHRQSGSEADSGKGPWTATGLQLLAAQGQALFASVTGIKSLRGL